MRRLHIIGSATACLSLIAAIFIAAPAQAGTAQRSTAPQEQGDQRIRADTGRGVQPVAWDQGLSPGRSAIPLHEIAKKYDGVDVMDGNAPGTAAVLSGLTTAVFAGGVWTGCTFSKLTGWIAKVVSQICRVTGLGGAISVISIISSAFRNASLIATKCYGINLSNPSSPLRDMPGRDCGF